MPESIRTRLFRLGMNLYPCFRGSGARITYIASGWREVHLKLPLSLRTRNYRGTIYGGSIYSAVDPIYMLMLIKNLGPAYNIWDKSAHIRFRKPGRSTLFAKFLLDDLELKTIRDELDHRPSVDRTYQVNLVDENDLLYASVEKTIFIGNRTVSE